MNNYSSVTRKRTMDQGKIFSMNTFTTNIKHNALCIKILKQSPSIMHCTLYSTKIIKHNALYITVLQQPSNMSIISYNFHERFVNMVNLYHHETRDFKNANTAGLVIIF